MQKTEEIKTNKGIKALALFSGGLDSTLAIKVILEQGIEVVALNFTSGFCRCDSAKNGCGSAIKAMANRLGVEFKAMYLGQDYLDMVKNPKHGYGKNLNPCIDCRIFKFKKAKEIMQEEGASFVITGEVLGQRPMSQHRSALRTIEKESGLESSLNNKTKLQNNIFNYDVVCSFIGDYTFNYFLNFACSKKKNYHSTAN